MKPNNFDLLRLVAAISVLFFHTFYRLDIEVSPHIVSFFKYIPGIEIFFFISGFLISLSYKNTSNIKAYIIHRLIRIYPALYLSLFLSICLIIYIGYLDISTIGTKQFWIWIIAQMSFAQFYNPDFLRGFGMGTLNGSLWSIAVELQFYASIPFLYKYLLTSNNKNRTLIILIIVFSVFNIIMNSLGNSTDFRSQSIVYKLLFVSFVPWFYMFLIGVFFQENFYKFKILTEASAISILIYIIIVLYVHDFFYHVINPFTFFLYSTVIYIFVFSFKNASNTILRRNDYSYGIYIYHAIIINYFIYSGYTGELKYLIYVLVISFALAFFSWNLIEKPILKLKKRVHS